ncbi:MAG TPA: hydroxyisourate hydrolase [Candidatus Acidoferrales bacterium]|jgi:5-hydroxyisourate hydrolase|nr:hydroxyisourate hydrolase [Candidatus Acidoferrales bacterium]
MSHITTHVLDVSSGRPAANVSVILETQSARGEWAETARGVTDGDGRLREWAAAKALPAGIYRLTFDTRAYFAARKIASLYPRVIIVFEVRDAQEHYHIPLLLSPFGYSTYRGS